MGKKNDRQKKLLALIAEHAIETQEEMISRLSAEGFEVTQATVSRDIRELHLVKSVDEKGIYRYAEKANGKTASLGIHTALTDSILSVDNAGNLVVIKTYPGMANAVASCIDSLKNSNILGCVAGDDTIFIAVHDPQYATHLAGDLFRQIRDL